MYRIASISKLVTSTAIMQLRDAGRLRLDDPVKQYLPWFTIRPAGPDAPVVTIRHLITHAEGIYQRGSFRRPPAKSGLSNDPRP